MVWVSRYLGVMGPIIPPLFVILDTYVVTIRNKRFISPVLAYYYHCIYLWKTYSYVYVFRVSIMNNVMFNNPNNRVKFA